MKLAHYLLNNPVEWKDHYINTFVIENSKLYREFLEEIYKQANGENGAFMLSEGLESLNFQKSVEVIGNLIEINGEGNKKISSAIIKELTDIAINDQNDKVLDLYMNINNTISSLIYESSQDLIFDEINDISQILKLYNLRPDFEELNLAEKTIFYMDLCEKYLKKKLFIFVNLHSFFTSDELDLIFKSIVYKKHNVFIIERYDIKALPQELKRIIDIDLCEI